MSDTTFTSTSIGPASSAGGPSSTTRPKRQLMNTAPSGSLPRALQLGSGSTTTSFSSNSPSPRPSSYPSGSSTPITAVSSQSGAGPASPSPLSPTFTNIKRGGQRRQSSISYIASSSPSQSQSSRHDSTDVSSLNLARSPLSSVHTTTTFSERSPVLGRSNSLGGLGRASNPSSRRAGERSGTGSLINGSGAEPEQKERPPLTLAERHADLLHFIAQKESKCLELRSQLAAHEAELAQLKRKWERIVNRGFEKSLSPSSAAPSSPSPTSTSLNPSSSPSTAYPSPYASTNGPLPGAVVLEGIKESVQGVSRLIAAGLESIGGHPVPSAYSVATESSSSTVRGAPLQLKLGRSITQGHMQKDSQSSSTSASTATSRSTNRSSWLSASTASSSATSGTEFSETWGSSTSGTDTNANAGATTTNSTRTDASEEEESEFGEFEDGQGGERDQVLMVRDTGATPTMSPNPDFQRRQRRAVRARSVSPNPGSAVTAIDTTKKFSDPGQLGASQPIDAGSTQANSPSAGLKEEFDWDDGWDEPVSEAQASDSALSASASVSASTFASSSAVDKSNSSASIAMVNGNGCTSSSVSGSGPKSPMAAMSSIPGLATISTVGAPTAAAQQMSSWVGTVGKKWGEIRGSSTFTKNQKRASVLISDMQQTLVSALISPPASGPPSDSSYSLSSTDPYHVPLSSSSSFSSNAFDFLEQSTSSSTVQSPAPKPKLPLSQPQAKRAVSAKSTSLLDESDDESFGGPVGDDATVRMRLGMGAPVLVPVPVSIKAQQPASPQTTRVTNGSTSAAQKKKQEEPEEEEWNW